MKLTEEQIEFLNDICYGGWTLNSNGEVDVDGNVNMIGMNLTKIPIKFGKVNGYFDCDNNQLTSLEFCPSEVGGDFSCYSNQLTSLEFCPSEVGGNFYCSNNQLTDYFKRVKEEDFPHWNKLDWHDILKEYSFLIDIAKKYIKRGKLKNYLNKYPTIKIYLT